MDRAHPQQSNAPTWLAPPLRAMSDDIPMASADEAPHPDVETLIAGRQKRATAGNRMHALLDKEEDDDLQLLFAENEEEEDVEFAGEDADGASDVDLGSSSDEDDQGPTAGADDLEGERELQRQAKAERKKKRKEQALVTRPVRRLARKFKGELAVPAASGVPPPKADKKKVERVSWLPTAKHGAVRQSSRKQTMQNKQYVHQRLKENEKKRRRQLQVMEAAAKRKDVVQRKVLTQADRMAEAARVEEYNAKSLNHWEEEEARRADDRRAKLAALKNRKLEGPYVTWWSGLSVWADDQLVATGRPKDVDQIMKTAIEKIKAKAVAQWQPQGPGTNENPFMQGDHERDSTRQSTAAATDSQSGINGDAPRPHNYIGTTSSSHEPKNLLAAGQPAEKDDCAKKTSGDAANANSIASDQQKPLSSVQSGSENSTESRAHSTGDGPAQENPDTGAATGEQAQTSLPSASLEPAEDPQTMNLEVTGRPADRMEGMEQTAAPQASSAEPMATQNHVSNQAAAFPKEAKKDMEQALPASAVEPSATESDTMPKASTPTAQPTIPDPTITTTARTLVVLENVQPSTFRNHVLMQTAPSHPAHRVKRIYKTAKYRADPAAHAAAVRAAAQAAQGDRHIQAPPPEKCAITGLPAHFRDPATGLPYHDIHAFRAIRDLKADTARWSNLLGCYIGPEVRAARGVPENFLRGRKAEE